MKELSVEQKAKRYDEAKLRMSTAYNSNRCSIDFRNEIFPELAESEDERIRKDLIIYLRSVLSNKKYGDKYIEDWITWLEHQCQVKNSAISQHENKTCKESDETLTSEDIRKGLIQYFSTFTLDTFAGLDSKKILAWLEKQGEQKLVNEEGWYFETGKWYVKTCHTYEGDLRHFQEGHVYQAVSETCITDGYHHASLGSWQIPRYFRPAIIDEIPQDSEQKPVEWSEEDEQIISMIITDLNLAHDVVRKGIANKEHKKEIDWLKFLKDRVQPQPKPEWSEEDERNASYICAALDCYYRLREDRNNTNGQEDLDKAKNWLYNKLKSIRPQNSSVTDEELALAKKDAYNDALDKIEYHSGKPTFDDGWNAAIWYLKKRNTMSQSHWKPSDEQMKALQESIGIVGQLTIKGGYLKELYEQLKKLKG